MGGGSDPKKQLGKILLQQKLVSADKLQEILDDQKREPGSRLASTAARHGHVNMLDALAALAEQCGVPGIDLTAEVVPLAVLRLIPVEIARERAVLPCRLDNDRLLLAMASPQEPDAIEELEFVAGKPITAHVALDHVLRIVIDQAYAALAEGQEYYVGAHVSAAQLAALGLPDLPRAPEPLFEPPSPSTPAPASTAGSLGEELDQAFAQRMMTSNPPPLAAPDASARVLLAARGGELRGGLARVLGEAGVGVLLADDGMKALESIRAEQPRLLVLDLDLPGVPGLDVCRKLRASQRFAKLPIVVLGSGDWRLARDLAETYAIKHVYDKPIDAAKLVRTARLLLEGRDVPEELAPLSAEAEAKWKSAMAGFERGDLDAAIAELESGVAVEPQAFELHYHLGLLYGRRDELFGAIRELEIAVRLQPVHFAAIKNLAVVYQRVGFAHKAFDTWERAMRAAPDDQTRANIKEHMIGLL